MPNNVGGSNPNKYMGVRALNPPDVVISQRTPTTSDTKHDIGTLWIDQPNDDAYILTSVSAASANWTLIGISSSPINDVAHGGTGLSTITDHGVLVGSGTDAITPLAVATSGWLLVGSTGADPVFVAATSTDSSITYALGAGTFDASVTAATTAQLGGGEIALDSEVIPETISTNKFLVPSNIAALKAYTNLTYSANPVTAQVDGTVTSGVDTEIDVAAFEEGINMEYYNIGTQTVLTPVMAALGLTVSRTETDNIGTEYGFGIIASSKHAYTIGTDGPFAIMCSFNVVDVSGVDPLVIGFRKLEAYNSTYSSYTDFASIGIVDETDPAKIQLVTNINTAGAVTTDTTDTWADGATHTLKVIVSAAGVVTYELDGAAPSSVAAFTFDTPDVVVPFISFAHATTTPGKVYMQYVKCGIE